MPKLDTLTTFLTADTRDFEKKMTGATKTINTVGHKFSSAGRSMSLYVTSPLMGLAALSVRAYGVQEAAEVALQSALKQTGAEVDSNADRLKKYASEVQKQTIYGDELVLQQMALGLQMGIGSDKIEEATKAAVGLAAAYNVDLKTAMQLIAKASQGNTSALSRYGITVSKSGDAQSRFNEVLKIGADRFSTAQEYARTTNGQIAQLNNEVGDLAEEIGRELLPIMKDILVVVRDGVRWFAGLSDSTKEWGVKLGLAAAALGPLAYGLGTVLKIGTDVVNMYKAMAAANVASAAGGAGMAGKAAGGLGGKLLSGAGLALGGKAALVAGTGVASFMGANWLQEKIGYNKFFGDLIGGGSVEEKQAAMNEETRRWREEYLRQSSANRPMIVTAAG